MLKPVTILVLTSDRTDGGREQCITGPEIPANFVPQAVDDGQNHHQIIFNDHGNDFQCPHGLLDADINTYNCS